MGVFDRWKKEPRNKQQTDVLIKSPQGFYNECVNIFHDEAEKSNFASKGLIFIPELIPMGEKTILAFLQDRFFSVEFGQNPPQYYYVIMSLSLQAGICYADKWHKDFSGLTSGYVDQIIANGPADDADRILKSTIGLVGTQNQNAFYQKIYKKWMACHEPYWSLQDPRQYTFKTMVAAYQLGISMTLEKYGF